MKEKWCQQNIKGSFPILYSLIQKTQRTFSIMKSKHVYFISFLLQHCTNGFKALSIVCFKSRNTTMKNRKLNERETHFTSLQYVWVWVSQIKTNTIWEDWEDWERLRERGYRTLIGIFVPTHFHQLCKFRWTFSRNLWCQSSVSVLCVLCVLCVHNKSKCENKKWK
jgi:hypothetical protein